MSPVDEQLGRDRVGYLVVGDQKAACPDTGPGRWLVWGGHVTGNVLVVEPEVHRDRAPVSGGRIGVVECFGK